MKKFLKKFKKFKLTAIVEGCAAVVSVITSILILVFYQTNNLVLKPSVGRKGPQETLVTGFNTEPILGMIFFLAALLAIVFGVVAVYGAYPYIFKKDEKLDPNRSLPWFGVACGGFALVEFVFTILMITMAKNMYSPDANEVMLEASRHTVGLLIAGIVLLLSAIVQLLMIIPTLMVQPEKE